MGAHRGAFLQIWEGLVEIRVQFGEGNVQSFGRHLNSGLSSQIKLGATNGKANNTMMLASIVFEEKNLSIANCLSHPTGAPRYIVYTERQLVLQIFTQPKMVHNFLQLKHNQSH